VLGYANDIAAHEDSVDHEVLCLACILHDIGRQEQDVDPSIDHAEYGASLAHEWLIENGYPADFADKVSHCILTHRFRSDRLPVSIEAKILFDADKLDACGAVGIARTLQYTGSHSIPLCSLSTEAVLAGHDGNAGHSFVLEYETKLSKLYNNFLTKRGSELAEMRREAAVNFYNALLLELEEGRDTR
jgi:uncharacterized protein